MWLVSSWCPCRERACSHRWRASTTHVDGRGKPRGRPLAYELIDGCESLGARLEAADARRAPCMRFVRPVVLSSVCRSCLSGVDLGLD